MADHQKSAYVIGVGMLRFGKLPERSIKDLSAEAVSLALSDAILDASELQAVWFANSAWGMSGGQDCIRGQVALRPIGIDAIPIVNVENACAGGSTALNGACLGVMSGAFDVALVIGAEKVFQKSRLRMFASFIAGLDVEALPSLIEQARQVQKELPPPEVTPSLHLDTTRRPNGHGYHGFLTLAKRLAGLPTLAKDLLVLADHYRLDIPQLVRAEIQSQIADRRLRGNGGGGHSPFMDVYAMAARRHMQRYGTTQRQMALIASKNHQHSSLNPLAQIQKPMTPDEVLADKAVAYPLTRSMCAPIGDGAAAAIICSERFLRRHGDRRAVRIRASVLTSGMARAEDDPDIATRCSQQAYERAGIGADEIDVAEVHDATAFGELHQSEALGFCREGEGGLFAESGATTLGGSIPLNTSGGLESRGHPIAASGLAQIHEIVTQLRGEGRGRQVEKARFGLAQNGGGALGVEEAAMGIHILEKTS